MDSSEEINAFIKTAEAQLTSASHALRSQYESRYVDCIYFSAVAAENAANALVLFLGGKIPRTHEDAAALRKIASVSKPGLLKNKEFQKILGKLDKLEHYVVMTRYPIRVEERHIPPTHFFTKQDAEKALNDAKYIVDVVRKLLQKL